LARKLLIALWRFVTIGEPLDGVTLRPARATRAAHRLVPVTTISTCRPPHLEQTSLSRQSRTLVSAPYRAAIPAGSGST
jgi:hypothetical protein